jgi:hypothetical protein
MAPKQRPWLPPGAATAGGRLQAMHGLKVVEPGWPAPRWLALAFIGALVADSVQGLLVRWLLHRLGRPITSCSRQRSAGKAPNPRCFAG